MSHAYAFTRREMVQLAAGQLAALGLASPLLAAPAKKPSVAAKQPAPGGLVPLNRFPQMMQEFLVHRVRDAEQAGLRMKNALRTKADAERYVLSVRARIARCFGPMPEKTPLEARVTGIVERDVYRIEKVIFQSRPGLLVTANLYVPKGRKFPLPGVVGTCGHSTNGKAAEAYQSFAQGLARMGYVVLLYDPLGQGERFQYADASLKSAIGPGVSEHLYAGNQQFLVGEFFGAWRAWDGIRALDYLLTRPEVDRRHLGVTGNSGGGTMTTWLCGVEQRWTMAAPSCFVTTFRRNAENELPADTEQCPPLALALGLDHDDWLAALAPKPIIILGKEQDFFDVRGTIEAYERLKRLYRLLDAEDNISLFVGPTPHGYSQENREAMYRWFNRVTRISDATTEPTLVIEKDETLWCTPRGQVVELQSKPIYSYTKAAAQAFQAQRKPLAGTALVGSVRRVLRLPSRTGVPDFRILRRVGGRKYPLRHFTTYLVQTEPDVHAVVYLLGQTGLDCRPPRGAERAVLYVSHQSSDAELRDEPLLAELVKAEPQSAFYTCDVRGIGDSQPNTCGTNTYLTPYGCDFFYAAHGNMLDRPYVGQRTHDVLCVLDWLAANGHREVHLVGKGWGALPATFAALLAPGVVQVTLKNALRSYTEVAVAERYQWPLSALLPGVLKEFDLTDCYRALAAKKLRQLDPWGPMADGE
jgi:dienelactone hydrolase/pimeloyl-ACP methyl ester carboxylesterase